VHFEILRDRIRPPAANNLTWVFPVRVSEANGPFEQQWLVDSFDLHLWFKETVGRYPRHERGDADTLQDLRENWDHLEPRLRREFARDAELDVVIEVDSARTSVTEWRAVQQIPKDELPPLRKSEREAAGAFKRSEEDYARSLLAAERTRAELIEKAERLARFLKQLLNSARPRAAVKKVSLRTLDGKFDVEVDVEGKRSTMHMDEGIFDDLLERGSEEAEHRLRKILEVNLPVQALR
jgi:hypothetical protein